MYPPQYNYPLSTIHYPLLTATYRNLHIIRKLHYSCLDMTEAAFFCFNTFKF